MNGIRETCHCGHDKASHYRDADGSLHSCLAMACDCKRFADANGPEAGAGAEEAQAHGHLPVPRLP